MRQLRYAPTEYEHDEEGRRRILGTVVLINGHPCKVMDIREGMVEYIPVDELNNFNQPRYPSVPLNDPSINVFNIPTGYVNLKTRKQSTAIYTRKRAVRNGLQGIRQGSLLIDHPPGDMRLDLSYNQMITNPGFVNMTKDIYPSAEEALSKMMETEEPGSIAFHRRLAYVRDLEGFPVHIHYRGKRVGWCPNTESVVLPKNKEYMSDILKEAKVLK